MPAATREGNILRIGDTIRIEPSPVLITAKATEEILSNEVTAAHYQASRPATDDEIADPAVATPDGLRTFVDVFGKPIVLGDDMQYWDHLGFARGDADSTCWMIYAYGPMTAAQRKERGVTEADRKRMTDDAVARTPSDEEWAEMTSIWHEIGCKPTEAEAISFATDHLISQATGS